MLEACNVLSDLRKNGQLCDAVIRVGDGHFTVHRAIMSACSPYFRALFTNGIHETDKREVRRHHYTMSQKKTCDMFYNNLIEQLVFNYNNF